MKKIASCILAGMLVFTSSACNKTTTNPPAPNINKPVEDINKKMSETPKQNPNQSVVPGENKVLNKLPGDNVTPNNNMVPSQPGNIRNVPQNKLGVTPNVGKNLNHYKNGTFIGKSDKTKEGYGYAKITVTKGKISSVVLKMYNSKGKEIKYTTSMTKDKNYMVNMIKTKQGLNFVLPTTNKPQVNLLKEAALRALNKAKLVK